MTNSVDFKAMSEVEISLWMEANCQTDSEYRKTRQYHPVCGVGINDSTYKIRATVDGERITDMAYVCWNSMMRRCYSSKFKSIRSNRSYYGIQVHESWHSFMEFRKWWLVNYREGYLLDKDLLTDKREYGPTTCVYVPQWVNNIATDSRNVKTGHRMGVQKNHKRFTSSISIGKQGVFLGYFNTADEAHTSWLLAKVAYILSRRKELLAIHQLLPFRLIDIVYQL